MNSHPHHHREVWKRPSPGERRGRRVFEPAPNTATRPVGNTHTHTHTHSCSLWVHYRPSARQYNAKQGKQCCGDDPTPHTMQEARSTCLLCLVQSTTRGNIQGRNVMRPVDMLLERSQPVKEESRRGDNNNRRWHRTREHTWYTSMLCLNEIQ